jgi:hypothetical protein
VLLSCVELARRVVLTAQMSNHIAPTPADGDVIDNYEHDNISTTTTRITHEMVASSELSATNSSSSLLHAYNWPFLSLSLFSIFGILGNFLVCITIKRDPSLQTKTNYYLFSLAITDLAVCVIVIPLSIIQDFSSKFRKDTSISLFSIEIQKI